MSQENVDRLVRATEAFNRLATSPRTIDARDLSDWLEFMDPEIQFRPQQAALQGTYVGLDGATKWLADLAEHYGKGQMEYSDLRDLGDRVLGVGSIHITGRASGIETDVPCAIVATFRGGLITEFQDYGDKALALAAAGLSE
jgi:ketosteroid isomerase-like protein